MTLRLDDILAACHPTFEMTRGLHEMQFGEYQRFTAKAWPLVDALAKHIYLAELVQRGIYSAVLTRNEGDELFGEPQVRCVALRPYLLSPTKDLKHTMSCFAGPGEHPCAAAERQAQWDAGGHPAAERLCEAPPLRHGPCQRPGGGGRHLPGHLEVRAW